MQEAGAYCQNRWAALTGSWNLNRGGNQHEYASGYADAGKLIWGLRRRRRNFWRKKDDVLGVFFAEFLKPRFCLFLGFFCKATACLFTSAHKAASHMAAFSKGAAKSWAMTYTHTRTVQGQGGLSWWVDILTGAAQTETAVGVWDLLGLILGLIYGI